MGDFTAAYHSKWGLKERGDKQRNQSSLVLRATKGEGKEKKRVWVSSLLSPFSFYLLSFLLSAIDSGRVSLSDNCYKEALEANPENLFTLAESSISAGYLTYLFTSHYSC